MRKAYSGRAAAYEKKGDYDRAVADYKMLVFSYAVELDAANANADSYDELLRTAAKAYRTRAACFQAQGDAAGAQRDAKRADKLEAKVKKVAEKDKAVEAPAKPPGRVTVRNDWTEPLTLVVAGASYTIQVGEMKTLPAPKGVFPYEMQAGALQTKGTLEEGRTYSFAAPPASPR
jgi:tetratricopeptide (TPR) repeat protein